MRTGWGASPRGDARRFAPFEIERSVARRHTIDLKLAPTRRRLTISTDDERIDRYVRTTYARLLTSHVPDDDAVDRAELFTEVRPARARFGDTLLPAPDASDPERPWNSGSYTTDQFIWRSLANDEGWSSLHGSALCIEGRGVLLVGASGCGKTTLSLALASAGAGWYGDEIALIERRKQTICAIPRTIAVRSRTLDVLTDPGLNAKVRRHGGSAHRNEMLYNIDARELFPHAYPGSPQPLRAVFVITGHHDEATVEPLSGAAGSLRIAPHLNGGRRDLEAIVALRKLFAGASIFELRPAHPVVTAELVSRTVGAC